MIGTYYDCACGERVLLKAAYQPEPSFENKTEGPLKRRPLAWILRILSMPFWIVVGLFVAVVGVYPRFYQLIGILFAIISGVGFVGDWTSGQRHHDAPPFGIMAIGGIVLFVGASIIRESNREKEAREKASEATKVEELLRRIRENPSQCPKCGSLNVATHYPSKPMVFTPLSFSGILLGGVANAMADRIFKPENVCQSCGCRWEIPE
jgi:hypothetical protein